MSPLHALLPAVGGPHYAGGVVVVTGAFGAPYVAPEVLGAFIQRLEKALNDAPPAAPHFLWVLGDEEACAVCAGLGTCAACAVLPEWHPTWKYGALATAVQLGAQAEWMDV